MRKPFSLISLEERKFIENSLKHMKSIHWIADSLNRDRKSIRMEIAKNGGVDSYEAQCAQENSIIKRIEANKRIGKSLQRSFSEEEKNKIIQWRARGATFDYIRSQLNCGKANLLSFCKENNIEGAEKCITILDRLSAIEEQIQILHEILTEMRR